MSDQLVGPMYRLWEIYIWVESSLMRGGAYDIRQINERCPLVSLMIARDLVVAETRKDEDISVHWQDYSVCGMSEDDVREEAARRKALYDAQTAAICAHTDRWSPFNPDGTRKD